MALALKWLGPLSLLSVAAHSQEIRGNLGGKGKQPGKARGAGLKKQ
jgi:hypothetical protein